MKTNDCIFCQIISAELPAEIIYQDELWLAFLDIKPIHLGHTLIIPKKHYRNLFDLPEEALKDLGPKLQELAKAITQATKADGLNVGWNNEAAAGQVIFHSHIHLIPRFNNDNLKHWPAKEDIKAEDLKTMAREIENNLT